MCIPKSSRKRLRPRGEMLAPGECVYELLVALSEIVGSISVGIPFEPFEGHRNSFPRSLDAVAVQPHSGPMPRLRYKEACWQARTPCCRDARCIAGS